MIEKITTPKKLKVPRRLKKLVIDSVKRHAWNIGVSHFTGDILYMEKDEPLTERGGATQAACVVDRRYLKATFKLYPCFIENWKHDGDAYVESTIAHEVAHIATQHLFDLATSTYKDSGEMHDAWESLTEIIGKISRKLDKQLHGK